MTRKIGATAWAVGDELLADDLNDTFDAVKNLQEFTLGENITAPAPVYVKASDGKVYKASSAANDDLLFKYVGVLLVTGVTNDVKPVAVNSVVDGLSLGDAFETVTETTEVTLTAGSSEKVFFGTTDYTKQSFITGLLMDNISSFQVYLRRAGTPDGLLTVAIYEVGTDGVATGSALVTKTFASGDLTTSHAAKEIITSAITVKPNQKYIVVITSSSSNLSNSTIGWFVQFRDTASTYINGELWSKENNGTAEVDLTGKAINFVMKYTKQRNYYVTDDIYLDATAGTFSLNPDTKLKKAGEILSSSSILVTDKHKDQFIYTVGITHVTGADMTSGAIRFPVPRNTKKILFTATANGGTKSSFEICFDGQNAPTIVLKDGSANTVLSVAVSGTPFDKVVITPTKVASIVAVYFR